MKSLGVTLLLLILAVMQTASATGFTRSAGKYADDAGIDLSRALSDSPLMQAEESFTAGNGERIAYHADDVSFDIFDAWISLSGDLDYDGFYHQLRVNFDADTSSEHETVYAKLYLSYEGGPWQQYAISELFDIHADAIEDTYEVVTELVQGYPAGYYSVLIELHSLFHPGIVASRVIDYHDNGYAIALEDLDHDDAHAYQPYEEVIVYGSSGSFSMAGLLILGLLLLSRNGFRYARSRSFKNVPVLHG